MPLLKHRNCLAFMYRLPYLALKMHNIVVAEHCETITSMKEVDLRLVVILSTSTIVMYLMISKAKLTTSYMISTKMTRAGPYLYCLGWVRACQSV